MSIPRKRRFPMRPFPRRINLAVSAPDYRAMVDAITAAVKDGALKKWEGDEWPS